MKADVLAAIEVCRERRTNSLLADPLAFPEFDNQSTVYHFDEARPVEVEFVTRPKQSGGTRLEIVPDFGTSVRLQVIAQRLAERELSLPHSVSATAIDSNFTHLHPYDLWWEPISTWIRHRLVEGKTVIVADIQNYFASLPISTIEYALRRVQLDEQSIETTLRTICDINLSQDQSGATRSGLPVSQDNLFWLIADLVLRPVDDRLSQDPLVAGHIRWVDDFFIAVDSDAADSALIALSTILEAMGLRLNESKTQILTSIVAFERQALTYEHRIVTSLTMIGSHGPLSRSQHDAFTRLVEMDRVQSVEHARLWKRIYTLAAHLRSSTLATEAIDDLGRFPTAEKQISKYLRILNWPAGTTMQAVNQLIRAPTDSQAISLLNAFLLSRAPIGDTAFSALKDISVSSKVSLHPYAVVQLHACLMSQQTNDRVAIARQIQSFVTDSNSPVARRFAIELLWLVPETRRIAAELISRDKSYTVRGLSVLSAIAERKSGSAVSLADNQSQTSILLSSPIGSELQHAFLRLAA